MFGKRKEKEEKMIKTSIGLISKDTLIHNKELVRRMFDEKIKECNTTYHDEFTDLRHRVTSWLTGKDWFREGNYSYYGYEEYNKKAENRSNALSEVLSQNKDTNFFHLIEQLCAEASVDITRKKELEEEMKELGL